ASSAQTTIPKSTTTIPRTRGTSESARRGKRARKPVRTRASSARVAAIVAASAAATSSCLFHSPTRRNQSQKRASHHEPHAITCFTRRCYPRQATARIAGGRHPAARRSAPLLESRHGAATRRRRELRGPQARPRRCPAPVHAPDPARERPPQRERGRGRSGLIL